ncbi:hypothetical protein H6P81_021216 [Aristolochia fimbriata]|uniref:Uncharacterized protein n=1 Tax=Aristolochia fimbriata TaxID=158543 RepID=A0AAV7DT35_ARIFI|nr:hypothetical protein H6P81_021216 [Aristolochia fimbriata]
MIPAIHTSYASPFNRRGWNIVVFRLPSDRVTNNGGLAPVRPIQLMTYSDETAGEELTVNTGHRRAAARVVSTRPKMFSNIAPPKRHATAGVILCVLVRANAGSPSDASIRFDFGLRSAPVFKHDFSPRSAFSVNGMRWRAFPTARADTARNPFPPQPVPAYGNPKREDPLPLRRRECLRFPWRVAGCPLASAPLSRACRPAAASASSPPSLGPKDDPVLGAIAVGSRVPQVAWGEAELRLSAQWGTPPGSTFFVFLDVFRTDRAGRGGTNRAAPSTRPPGGASPTTACPWGRKAPNVGRQAKAAKVAPEEPTSKDQKQRRYERLGCHKPVIPVMCRPSQTPHLTMSSPGSFRPARTTEQKEGQCPPPTNGIILSRLFGAGEGPKGGVPDPSPRRRGDQLSPSGSASSSPPTTRRVGTGTPCPALRANPFSRIYGSILPTSLAYIVPSTRGCSPWRPDAVMMYDQAWAALSVLQFFKGARGYPDTAAASRCSSSRWTLPPAEPFSGSAPAALRPGSRPRFSGSRPAPSYSSRPGCCPAAASAVGHRNPASVHPASPVLLTKMAHLELSIPTSRRAPAILRGNFGGNQLLDGSISLRPYTQVRRAICRVGIAAGLHPSFLWPPRSGIVHHLSGPDSPLEDPANQLPCALRVWSPLTSHTCQTPWSVFQGGLNGEPAGRRQKRRRCPRERVRGRSATLLGHRGGVSAGGIIRRAWGRPVTSVGRRPSRRRTGSRRPALTTGASPGPIRFPPTISSTL